MKKQVALLAVLALLVACQPDNPPSAPSNLKSIASASSISLGWDASTGATSYTIERKVDTGNFNALTTVSDTQYNDADVTQGTGYSYRVLASNSSGSSAWVETPTVSLAPTVTYQANPLTVQPQYATASATSAEIGPEGGTLSLVDAKGTRFTLKINPDTLYFKTNFTMTPLTSVNDAPGETGVLGGVRIEPEDVIFPDSATLQIVPTSAPETSKSRIGFKFYGQGTSFHLRPLEDNDANSDPLQMTLALWGGGTFGLIDLNTEQTTVQANQRFPSSPFDAFAQFSALEQIQNTKTKTTRLDRADRVFFAKALYDGTLNGMFEHSIQDYLSEAVSQRATIAKAEAKFKEWLANLKKWNLIADPVIAPLVGKGWILLAKAYVESVRRSVNSCFDEKKPGQGFVANYWVKLARKIIGDPMPKSIQASMSSDLTALLAEAEKCFTFTLEFDSHLAAVAPNKLLLDIEVNAIGNLSFDQAVIPLEPKHFNIDVLGKCGKVDSITHHLGDPGRYTMTVTVSDEVDLKEERQNNFSTIVLKYNPGNTLQGYRLLDTCQSLPPIVVPPETPLWFAYFYLLHENEYTTSTALFSINTWNGEIGFGDAFTAKTYAEKLSIDGTEVSGTTTIRIKHTPQR